MGTFARGFTFVTPDVINAVTTVGIMSLSEGFMSNYNFFVDINASVFFKSLIYLCYMPLF